MPKLVISSEPAAGRKVTAHRFMTRKHGCVGWNGRFDYWQPVLVSSRKDSSRFPSRQTFARSSCKQSRCSSKKYAIITEIRLSFQNDILAVLIHTFLAAHEAASRPGSAKFRESACNASLDCRPWSYEAGLKADPLARACIGRPSLRPACCPDAIRVA
jgi:hypothetical protein